jgi:CDP-4-dehydro-6-deoxyglucose reductase
MLIHLENSGRQFEASEGEIILDAAERAGISLPYSCRDGICGTCKGRLCSGEVDHGFYASTALTEPEREQGYFLMCTSTALGDLLVDAPVEELGFAPSPLPLEGRVLAIEYPTADVAILRIGLPPAVIFRFRAGQYVELLLADRQRRSFSIANAPSDTGAIELHVRRVPGGMFTPTLFGTLKAGDPISLVGPKGGFYLRTKTRPVVIVASGTGFAPIRSMVLDALHRKLKGPATLYWGGRRKSDLYLHHEPLGWQQRNPGFRYVPVLSEVPPDDAWVGRTGLVHEAVLADFPDLSGHDVYACGVPAMVEAARRDFIGQCGLPPAQFYADRFLTTADRQPGSRA